MSNNGMWNVKLTGGSTVRGERNMPLVQVVYRDGEFSLAVSRSSDFTAVNILHCAGVMYYVYISGMTPWFTPEAMT
jgi:hypothetical protein